MHENDLASLYQVHLIDEAILNLKARAGALDGGKAIRAQFEALKAEKAPELQALETLEKGIAEAEQKAKSYRDKAATIEKHLFSGKVVNPKEIAGYETELAQFKKMADDADWHALELGEQLGPVRSAAQAAKKELQALAKEYERRKVSDQGEAVELQTAYKEANAQRGPAAARVSQALLAQYDAIRQKAGTGMGLVRESACGSCGTELPTKLLQSVREDKVMTCPSCHRILFSVVPGA